MEFKLNLTPVIEFGPGKLDSIGDLLDKNNQTKALIITGKKSSKANSALERVKKSLEEKKIDYIVDDNISSEPDTDMVDRLRELAYEHRVDAVIGLGGGSQLDVAKVVAGLYGQSLPTLDYLRKEPFSYRGIPFYGIPTTSGTASEVTLNSVLLDKEKNNKYSIANDNFQAKAAIIDPELTYCLSEELVAGTGMDAFTHAIESLVSYESNEFTQFLAEEAVMLILRYLYEAIKNDHLAKEYMAKASLYAGMAFAQTGVGLSHAISHPLGALYHIPHGVANAIVIPKVITFNMKTSREEYNKIEQKLGTELTLGEYIQNIVDTLPIDTNLRDYGFKLEDAPKVAKLAMEGRSYLRNPRIATEEEIIDILEQCY